MKHIQSFALLFLSLLISSCEPQGQQTGQTAGGSDTTRIVKQYYPNKKLKQEVSMKDTLRHGITKTYSQSGTLLSEVLYLNGLREGRAVNYYPEGPVHSEIFYKRNLKVGESKWYYPSGKLYRITSYVNGENEGVQKTYFENGKLMAEIPYSNGKKCPGLKEYLDTGKPRVVPDLLLESKDQVAMQGVFKLRMHLSNQTRTVKYYLGSKNSSPCLSGYEESIPAKNGVGEYEIAVFRGQTIMQKLDIYAVETTSYGNERILHKSYNLALRNR